MCYCYGDSEFIDDNGCELTGHQLDEAESYNYLEILGIYAELLPLVGNEIIDLWIDDGSMFGIRPGTEYINMEIEKIKQYEKM